MRPLTGVKKAAAKPPFGAGGPRAGVQAPHGESRSSRSSPEVMGSKGVALPRAPVAVPSFLAVGSARVGLAVASVEVQGREHASGPAILAALGVSRGSPILAVDPASAKQRLEQVPWIRSASIYRHLPDTLFVHIVEQMPLAFWQRQGQLTLIDQDGRPIATNDLGAFSNLPVLVGDDVPQTAAKLLALLATEPELATHVASAVRVGERRGPSISIWASMPRLPEENPVEAWHRLAEFEKRDRILERDVTMVDLRLSDRVFLHVSPDPAKSPDKRTTKSGRPA